MVLHQVGPSQRRAAQLRRARTPSWRKAERRAGTCSARRALAHFFPEALEAAAGRPVVLAGGIADAEDVRAALGGGAAAVLCGSRFLLTTECPAHAEYKRRVLGATRTLETTLFGVGSPARHHVVPNAATNRWCTPDGTPRRIVRVLTRMSASSLRAWRRSNRLGYCRSCSARQSHSFRTGSAAPGSGRPHLEVTPLYAGACVQRIGVVISAEEAVRALAP